MRSSDVSPCPKKAAFFSPWQCLFRRNASGRNLGVIFELFVLCLPFDRASLSCVNCKADRGPDGIEQLHQQRRDNERKEKSCVHSMTSSLYISLFFLCFFFLLCKYHFYANHVCRQHNDFNTQTEVVQRRVSSISPRSRSPSPTSALFNITEQIETKKGCEPKLDCDYSRIRTYFCVHTTPRPQGSQY